jgi:hypothetical protein
MPVGICKLCLQNRVLEDSHLLPAALYRMSRWEGSANPNPMLISSRGRLQTSKQIKNYVFCHDCEQRLSRNGERYTMLQVNRKEGFKLLQTLRTSTNMRSAGGFTFYYETSALGIDRQKLAYFAMSVFWRAAVHLWHRPEQKDPIIRLGVYEEPIRKYLMEEAPFPPEMAILLFVCTDSHAQNVFYQPSQGNLEMPYTWTFQTRGLNFYLSGMEGMPPQLAEACLINGPKGTIAARSCEEKILDATTKIMIEASKRANHDPRGTKRD